MRDESHWTDERLDLLKKLWNDGLPITQIGKELGVSRNAVAGKVHRIGLPKRPSPIPVVGGQSTEGEIPSEEQSDQLPLNLKG